MSVSRDTFLTSREEEKNATASQMCARLFMSNAQRYVCTAWECAENKKRRGEKERERGESIDVKNKTTRCERIDEPALLKRACIRAVPKWQKKKKKKKKEERKSHLRPGARPRGPSSPMSIKLLSTLSSELPFLFLSFAAPRPFTPEAAGKHALRKIVVHRGLTKHRQSVLRNMQMLKSRVMR